MHRGSLSLAPAAEGNTQLIQNACWARNKKSSTAKDKTETSQDFTARAEHALSNGGDRYKLGV